MKHIDIIISTRKRLGKLIKTLTSIPLESYIHIKVIFDGDKTGYKLFLEYMTKTMNSKIMAYLTKEHKGAVYCRNLIIPKCKDGVLYATDDILFMNGSIRAAFNAFNEHFPDDDGVVGFVIDLPDWHPTGVALIGKKFINRYPKRQLFYPGYFHFSCQEVYWLAKKFNKFYQESMAIVKHRHPCFYKKEMDETHGEARIYREKDHALKKRRQIKGLIWGDKNG